MSGIAGMVDLTGKRTMPAHVLEGMLGAIEHRGDNQQVLFQDQGICLGQRGFGTEQPSDAGGWKESIGVEVVLDGTLFQYAEMRARLEGKGHVFRSGDQGELIARLWQEYGLSLFDHLTGSFALALWDGRKRQLLLARDRFGICPLVWCQKDDRLLFASEIKALLGSGLVTARADLQGINHLFTFFAQPGPVTCFQGLSSLRPGHFLDVSPATTSGRVVQDRTYFEMDFPDQGQEETGAAGSLVDHLEEILQGAVARRLSATGMASYLSSGVDSGLITALACKHLGEAVPTLTVSMDDAELNEVDRTHLVADHLGTRPGVLRCGTREVMQTYPALVQAVEGPVVDTACTALLLLAEKARAHGFGSVLTGEGADELLGSYSWFRIHKIFGYLDHVPGLDLGMRLRRLFLRWTGSPMFPIEVARRAQKAVGGPNAWLDAYGMISTSKLHFFSPEMRQVMMERLPYNDLDLKLERMKRWHPFNRSLYLGLRVNLPGLLLLAKGDRVAMRSGVEPRYPFLDEKVFAFFAGLHPRWKMRGFTGKYILRLLAERYLPKAVAWRRKALFWAPFDSFFSGQAPAYVDQLLSAESLGKTGYFNGAAVAHWRKVAPQMKKGSFLRNSVEMGLVAVFSTQLWHHLFIDASLADLPGREKKPVEVLS
jgi:asparagine synthase (glutamine-hydrolysing)